METLEIEDLKNLLSAIAYEMKFLEMNASVAEWIRKTESLKKSRSIIEQLIKDREFEQSQTTLPKL